MAAAVRHGKYESQVSNTSIQQSVTNKKQSSIYQMAAKKLVQNAPLIIMTTVALNALASLPVASAHPCDSTHSICVSTCMAMGGPDPRETGACLIGCRLAYWACRGASLAFGYG